MFNFEKLAVSQKAILFAGAAYRVTRATSGRNEGFPSLLEGEQPSRDPDETSRGLSGLRKFLE